MSLSNCKHVFVFIFILSCFTVGEFSSFAIQSDNSIEITNNQNVTSIANGSSDRISQNQLNFLSEDTLDLNITSEAISTINLTKDTPYAIDESSESRLLEISSLKSYKNIIDLDDILLPNLQNYGSGNLNYTQINDKLSLDISDISYSSSLSTILSHPLTGDEYFELLIDQINFNYNSEDFAFANLIFEFNNFKLIFVFQNSQSFIDFGFNLNSSDTIKILNPLSSITRIRINDIVTTHNLINPNLIKSITWDIYSNNPYSFSAIFGDLNLITSVSPEIVIDEVVYDLDLHNSFDLLPNKSYLLTILNNSTLINLQLNFILNSSTTISTQMTYQNEQLSIQGILHLIDFESDSIIQILFPIDMIVIEVNSSYSLPTYNYNAIYYNFTNSDFIHFKAKYTLDLEFNFNLSDVAQGHLMKLISLSQIPIGGRIIGSDDEISNLKIKNSIIEYLIPSYWARGEISIILWFSNGGFTVITEYLQLYPSLSIFKI
ncbi:MAG: hypothetical protein ACXAC2_22490 [Candidatus Kariarchaeaceae archaeon]|jgi:hypothetical protein